MTNVEKLHESIMRARFLVIYNSSLGDGLSNALDQATHPLPGLVFDKQTHWLTELTIKRLLDEVDDEATVIFDRMESVTPDLAQVLVKGVKENNRAWVCFIFVVRNTETLADAQKACPALMEFDCEYGEFLDWRSL